MDQKVFNKVLENNKIYFHSGKVGHKLDAIAKNNKVSFCVYDKGYHKDGHWSLNIKSVIVFGHIYTVNEWKDDLIVAFSKRFTDDTEYIYSEIKKFKSNTVLLCLNIEHITGKLVNEAWSYARSIYRSQSIASFQYWQTSAFIV